MTQIAIVTALPAAPGGLVELTVTRLPPAATAVTDAASARAGPPTW